MWLDVCVINSVWFSPRGAARSCFCAVSYAAFGCVSCSANKRKLLRTRIDWCKSSTSVIVMSAPMGPSVNSILISPLSRWSGDRIWSYSEDSERPKMTTCNTLLDLVCIRHSALQSSMSGSLLGMVRLGLPSSKSPESPCHRSKILHIRIDGGLRRSSNFQDHKTFFSFQICICLA